MLVLTLALAAVGFALLIVALMTGSVLWAWGCIAICVVGAVLLLVTALSGRAARSGEAEPEPHPARRAAGHAPRHGRHEKPR